MENTSAQNIVTLACNYLKFNYLKSKKREICKIFQQQNSHAFFFEKRFFSVTALHRDIHPGKSRSGLPVTNSKLSRIVFEIFLQTVCQDRSISNYFLVCFIQIFFF